MPRPEYPLPPSLTRRDVLLAAGAGALSLTLPGCGGGGGGHHSGGTASKPVTVAGMVEPGGFATSGGLSISNVYGLNAPVAASGEFTTTASSTLVAPHFVTDASGNLAGMSISIPGQTMKSDAESTLLGILFMAPGIMAQDPSNASLVVGQLRTQASYQSSLAYLRANLPTVSLQSLLTESALLSLLEQCVTDYISSGARSRSTSVGPMDGFSVEIPSGDLTRATVKLKNDGWRVIQVDRIEYDNGGNAVFRSVPTSPPMFGKAPPTVDDILKGEFAKAGTKDDAHLLNLRDTAKTEYWVQGPGLAEADLTLPQGITRATDLEGISLVLYLVFPVFLFVLNTEFKVAAIALAALNLFLSHRDEIAEELGMIAGIVASGRSAIEMANALRDPVWSIIKKIVRDLAVTIGLLTLDHLDKEGKNEKLENLKDFLGVTGIAFIGITLVGLPLAWLSYKPVSHLTIESSGDGGVIIQ